MLPLSLTAGCRLRTVLPLVIALAGLLVAGPAMAEEEEEEEETASVPAPQLQLNGAWGTSAQPQPEGANASPGSEQIWDPSAQTPQAPEATQAPAPLVVQPAWGTPILPPAAEAPTPTPAAAPSPPPTPVAAPSPAPTPVPPPPETAAPPPPAAARAPAPTPAPRARRTLPAGLTLGASLTTALAADLGHEVPTENIFEWNNLGRVKVGYRLGPNFRFLMTARAAWNIRVGRDGGVEADANADLDQLYLNARKGPFSLLLGKAVVSWGPTLLLNPVDIINPRDTSRTFLPLGDAGVLPILLSRASVRFGRASLQFVWAPFYVPSRQSWWGRDFSAFRPGLLEEALPNSTPTSQIPALNDFVDGFAGDLVGALHELDPWTRDGIQTYLGGSQPEEYAWNGDYFLRFAASAGPFDFGVSGGWYNMDQPVIEISDDLAGPLVHQRWPTSSETGELLGAADGLDLDSLVSSRTERSWMAAGDVQVAAGELIFSGSAAWKSKTVHYTENLEPYLSPLLQYVVGLRYTYGSSFFANVEFGHDIILRFDEETFVQQKNNMTVMALLRGSLLRDTLELQLLSVVSPSQRDYMFAPQVSWEFIPGWKLGVGARIFGSFVPLAPMRSIGDLFSYEGGLLGYYDANDYAYLSVGARW